jgi:hypothetical protein
MEVVLISIDMRGAQGLNKYRDLAAAARKAENDTEVEKTNQHDGVNDLDV